MRVIVIDDMKANQDSALELKKDGHTVTVLGTVEEARSYFNRCLSQIALRQHRELGRLPQASMRDIDEGWSLPDVVLTDLWMPAPVTKWEAGCERIFGGNPYHPEHDTNRTALIPAGLVLSIKAANLGIRLIAILTDSDHHNDQLVATMDMLGWDGPPDPYSGIRKFEARYFQKGEGGPKDWVKLLKKITRQRNPS